MNSKLPLVTTISYRPGDNLLGFSSYHPIGVDGLFTGNPEDDTSELVPTVIS